jgi:pimeloyl-ACP methyl ester carboxylesterase
MLLITGERDHIAPPAIARASYRKQQRNNAVTRLQQIPGRGHSLVFDSGWREITRTSIRGPYRDDGADP